MTELKAAIFDLGGTLVDDRQLVYTAHSTILGESSNDVPSRAEFDKEFTSNWVELYEKRGLHVEPAKFFRQLEGFTSDKKYLQTIKLYAGTVDALERIKKKMHIALNTSFRKKEAAAILRLVPLPKFDAVATGDDITRLKPDPHSIGEICTSLKVVPSECVMVGDTSADILCGKNAGTRTIAVTWGTNHEKDLAKLNPDLIAYSWKDILEFLGV